MSETAQSEVPVIASIFSQPWSKSDVVLVVDDKMFHVHRFILSVQSPVFKAMLNGDFKEASQDKIELKDETYEPMLQFLKLLYPPNMLDDDGGEVKLDDNNIIGILKIADKYQAKNVIKQCTKEVKRLKPENAVRLLPYALRYKFPLEPIFDVINCHVSTNMLKDVATTELNNDRVYIQSLEKKCVRLENVVERANTMMLFLLHKYVEVKSSRKTYETKCAEHESCEAKDFKKAKKCKNCLKIYKKHIIDQYIFSDRLYRDKPYLENATEFQNTTLSSEDFIALLKLSDDIADSLRRQIRTSDEDD